MPAGEDWEYHYPPASARSHHSQGSNNELNQYMEPYYLSEDTRFSGSRHLASHIEESDYGVVNEFTEDDIEDIFRYARHGRIDDMEFLLSRGMPVDVRDEWGSTLLIIACQNGNKRVAKLVLRKGADINARNNKGECFGDW